MLPKLILIALGGAVGALARYGLSFAVHSVLGRGFPYGTLSVNVVGSIGMGLIYALAVERGALTPDLRTGLMVGLLGAFTTFSTFSMETLGLLETGEPLKAAINVLLSVLLCIVGCWAGVMLGRQV